ncbi:MAG TPA: ubiquinol-cytochrome C chaperone family protein [Rhizomicrobium sp.]|jgi:cytochrome b pre-mRNA-processing protein 3|nr:ubiquinol-cytochrome C chaperone family protein [Rhizomicrobium sp.]
MLNILRRRATEKKVADDLYGTITAASRRPEFYTELGVADTFDGRFDLVVLHAWLVLDALGKGKRTDLGERLIQTLLAAFDDSLRAQGAGDMSIGRRSKAMTSAMFGRIKSYGAATNDTEMAEALIRNLYRDDAAKADCARALTHYISASRAALEGVDLTTGSVPFVAPRTGASP